MKNFPPNIQNIIVKDFIINKSTIICFFVFFLCLISTKPVFADLSGISVSTPGGKVKSLSQYGITWTFAEEVEFGTYVTGDFWVLGPVDIINISPAPGLQVNRIVNGSMLNPEVSVYQGYDSNMMGPRESNYIESLNVAMPNGSPVSESNPLHISSGSLVSAESQPLDGNWGSRVRLLVILTVVASEPDSGSFRPPYVGTDKSSPFNIRNVDFSKLPNLSPPQTPDWMALHLTNASDRFDRSWIEHIDTWIKEISLPPENMANYGATIALHVSELACLLTIDIDKVVKEKLAISLIQIGLDNYGIVQTDPGRQTWLANGGHMSGRAFPIIFAGFMLESPTILNIMNRTGQYAYSNGYHEGNLPPDYIHFGEMDQVFYVTQRDVDRTHSSDPNDWTPDYRDIGVPYETSDIGMPEWGFSHAAYPSGDNNLMTSQYRSINTAPWVGFVLASRILGIQGYWNHDALFDYIDRWMQTQYAYNEFLQSMWETYRSSY